MASASSYSIMTASREADGWWLLFVLAALLAVLVISVAWAFAGHNEPLEEIRDSLNAVRAMSDEGATPDD